MNFPISKAFIRFHPEAIVALLKVIIKLVVDTYGSGIRKEIEGQDKGSQQKGEEELQVSFMLKNKGKKNCQWRVGVQEVRHEIRFGRF